MTITTPTLSQADSGVYKGLKLITCYMQYTLTSRVGPKDGLTAALDTNICNIPNRANVYE